MKKKIRRFRDNEKCQIYSSAIFTTLFLTYAFISCMIVYYLVTGIVNQDFANSFSGMKQTIGLMLSGPVLWVSSISLSHFFNARKVKMITFVLTLCCKQCALSNWAAHQAKTIFLDKIWSPSNFMNFDAVLLPAMSILFMILGAFVPALPLIRFIRFHLKRTDIREKIREFDPVQ